MGSGPRTTSRSRARARSRWLGVVHTNERLTRDHCGGFAAKRLHHGAACEQSCCSAGAWKLSQPAQAMVRSSDAGGAGGLLPVAAATSRTASCCRCGARLLRLPEQPPLPEERDSWGGPLVRELGVALWCGITTHGHGESSRRAHLQRCEVGGAPDVAAAALVQDAS